MCWGYRYGQGKWETDLDSFRKTAEGFKALDCMWLMVAWVMSICVNAEVDGEPSALDL